MRRPSLMKAPSPALVDRVTASRGHLLQVLQIGRLAAKVFQEAGKLLSERG